jgi:hypothetical protein
MLHFQTIDTSTLELLKKLQSQPAFEKLRLVGGTSLALQIGHRKSIDIDLFGEINADEFEVLSQINSIAQATIIKKTQNINIFLLNGIKVDIVNYPYQWLSPPVKINDLSLADKKDIAAMKLSAITGRGTRKDFIDLFFLLKQFSLKEMLGFYKKKYPDGSEFLVLKSLTYFIDADEDELPLMLIQYNWGAIKKHIQETVKNYLKQ